MMMMMRVTKAAMKTTVAATVTPETAPADRVDVVLVFSVPTTI
jgi:hypothetical protein